MYQNKSISQLTHDELVNAMKELNLNIGPITSSTRRIYENRLKSHLELKNNIVSREEEDIDSTDSKTDVQNEPLSNETAQNIADKSTKRYDLKLNTDQEVVENEDGTFFGVWIPYSPTRFVDKSKPNVYRSREDALKKVKEYRGSRFKSFSCRTDAADFSFNLPSPYSVDKICTFINSPKCIEPPKTVIKGPSFQELMKFRRNIEEDDLQFVQQCLYNPKYLISSSDMPVILQEGTRLNAIHVAVKYNRLNMCQHIIQTIQCDEFLSLMYPDTSDDLILFRKTHLLDLYLNTPEKMLCATPLHLACKFGFPDIVEYLLRFKELNVNAKNKDGKRSMEIICARINARGETKQKITETIRNLFQEKAFIPLYEVNENVPKVGEPIITLSKDRIELVKNKIKAYAGPMSPDKASSLYCMWKKSPRNKLYSQIAGTDYEKGMERIGRAIASKENVPFAEYWHFLSTYTNLSSSEGLRKLENYLRIKSEHIVQENRENKKRRSFSSSGKQSQSRLSTSPDDVKRRLTFEFQDESNSEKSINTDEQLNDNHNHLNSKLILQNNNDIGDCFCACGELLEYCDKCTVDINIDELSVSFKTCSPPQSSSTSKNRSNTNDRLMNGVADDSSSRSSTVEENGTLSDPVEESKPDVFIDGNIPSKHDLDVLRALGNGVIDNRKYPHVERWKELVESYPDQLKTSWPSPGSPRYPKTLKRNILWTA